LQAGRGAARRTGTPRVVGVVSTAAPIPISWVDAFTDVAFGGNPAAVCLLSAEEESTMSDQHMQSLAHELGISETAFVSPEPSAGPDTFALRWFSPSMEIDLCGHATLASAHVLRQRLPKRPAPNAAALLTDQRGIAELTFCHRFRSFSGP